MESDELRNRNSEEDSVEFQIEDLPLKHSGIGIASFVVSLVTGIALFVMFAIIIAAQVQNPDSFKDDSAQTMILGLFVISIGFLDLIALGLGIGGLFHKKTKKIFAILGVILSGIILITFGLFMIIGMLA